MALWAVLGIARSVAAPVEARWNGGPEGRWSDPMNWDIHEVPNNHGTTTYSVILEGGATILLENNEFAIDSLGNSGQIELLGKKLTVTGSFQNSGTLTARCTLQLSGLSVANTGGVLQASNDGTVDLTDATVQGGGLEAVNSGFVRLGGNVTLHGVTWSCSGGGSVGADTGTLQFHGDYAHRLPAGYTLELKASGAGTTLLLPAGSYQNDGTLKLTTESTGQWTTKVRFAGDATLSGSGQIEMHSPHAFLEGDPSATLTVGAQTTVAGIGNITLPVVNRGTIEGARCEALPIRR